MANTGRSSGDSAAIDRDDTGRRPAPAAERAEAPIKRRREARKAVMAEVPGREVTSAAALRRVAAAGGRVGNKDRKPRSPSATTDLPAPAGVAPGRAVYTVGSKERG